MGSLSANRIRLRWVELGLSRDFLVLCSRTKRKKPERRMSFFFSADGVYFFKEKAPTQVEGSNGSPLQFPSFARNLGEDVPSLGAV